MTNLNETLFTAGDSICSELYVGTREEWKYGNMDAFKSWYGDWVQENTPDMRIHDEERDGKIEELMTFDEWLELTLDDALTEADEDEIAEYKRLDPVGIKKTEKEIEKIRNEAPETAGALINQIKTLSDSNYTKNELEDLVFGEADELEMNDEINEDSKLWLVVRDLQHEIVEHFSNDVEHFSNDVEIVSVESGEGEEVIIVTECKDEKHEWIMQTTEGRFDTSLGCLEFLNGEEFDRDDFTEIEKLHYGVANDCFNENASKFYEEKKAEAIKKAGNYFYAESFDELSCDLHRFTDEDERDEHVESVNNADNGATAKELSSEEAMEQHKDQFHHWNS